jgi:hypothetical protein
MVNMVFAAIGFVYPDYRYPLRGQEKKRKIAVSVTPAEHEPKSRKVKVLTHQPRYIEPAAMSEFGAGSTSAAEATQTTLITQSAEEPTIMPKTHAVEPVEDKVDKAEEIIRMPKILRPLTEAKLPKVQRTSAATPKRRMSNVLDAVLKTTKALSPAATKKVAEATKNKPKPQAEVEAAQAQTKAEAGPSVPIETEPAAHEVKTT